MAPLPIGAAATTATVAPPPAVRATAAASRATAVAATRLGWPLATAVASAALVIATVRGGPVPPAVTPADVVPHPPVLHHAAVGHHHLPFPMPAAATLGGRQARRFPPAATFAPALATVLAATVLAASDLAAGGPAPCGTAACGATHTAPSVACGTIHTAATVPPPLTGHAGPPTGGACLLTAAAAAATKLVSPWARSRGSSHTRSNRASPPLSFADGAVGCWSFRAACGATSCVAPAGVIGGAVAAVV